MPWSPPAGGLRPRARGEKGTSAAGLEGAEELSAAEEEERKRKGKRKDLYRTHHCEG